MENILILFDVEYNPKFISWLYAYIDLQRLFCSFTLLFLSLPLISERACFLSFFYSYFFLWLLNVPLLFLSFTSKSCLFRLAALPRLSTFILAVLVTHHSFILSLTLSFVLTLPFSLHFFFICFSLSLLFLSLSLYLISTHSLFLFLSHTDFLSLSLTFSLSLSLYLYLSLSLSLPLSLSYSY